MSVRRYVRSPFVAAAAIALLVMLSVLGLRGFSALEALELGTYDRYMRLRPLHSTEDPRILLVVVTERDIQHQGAWPLPDGVLAQALETLLRHRPRAIGLDIYRDVPVPPGTDRLERVLTSDPRIIAVRKFGEGASDGVRPPPVLKDTDQVGFNDILVDPGGTVRRALLFLDDGVTVVSSFALRLALVYLQAERIVPVPDPSDPGLLKLGATTIHPLEGNDGGYVRADTRGYQFLLDFESARGGFATVDLASLTAGTFDPRLIADRVVLVGVVADSIKDSFFTPYRAGGEAGYGTPGVAVHAHIVSQLLRFGLEGATPMRTLVEWQEIVWILVWSLGGAWTGFRVRSPWWFALVGAAGIAALGLLAFGAFLKAWWIPVVPPAFGWAGSAAVVTAYMSYQEMRQRGHLMQLFSRHVSKEVAEAIWRTRDEFLDGGRPRSQGMVVTALFTDLTGFTTVSEKLPPEALMEWLNEYMDAMAHQVARYGGVIRQYAGDSVVAVFGVPVARRNESEIARDAANAVRCALGMEETLRELNQRWRAEHRPTTGMRVGIVTGPAVAGTLGSAERSEYVVVGDTMNTASRLESFDKTLFAPDSAAHPCRILISETTLARLDNQFAVERVGDVSLKGKEQTVGVYRVLGPT